ncbi:hypothetical protein [Mycobacterium basiliense]|uniref:hypothetical protein n=1 Tax=Mycobacterium basiliense TaxID=2094119 RepID=UPI001E599E04|nr:hypothetical protein [Mycobacterium basiliense]
MRAGGINIEAGTLFLAVVEPSDTAFGTPVVVSQPRLAPHQHLVGAEALHDFTERVRQELDAAAVRAVGLVETRAFYNLQYKHVYPRVTAMCAVMAACTALGVGYETLKTETIGAAVGCPAKQLKTVDLAKFAFASPPTYWTTGLAEAYAAAATVIVRNGA